MSDWLDPLRSVLDASDDDTTEPVLDFAGIRLQGPTSVVVELAP